ncbi:MAG: hypothetical protein M1814_001136 [Vezdaea aestivalis]|nr:MAG: hypothetical protein M1814_001136 [Vezdaea aestivalis]
MRPLAANQSPSLLLLFLSALFTSPSSATNPGCDRILAKGKSFDLSGLKGPHSFWVDEENSPHKYNSTYTLDICRPLERPKAVKNAKEWCHSGAYVCAVKRFLQSDSDVEHSDRFEDDPERVHPSKIDFEEVQTVVTIAGDFAHNFGLDMDAKWTLLSDSSSSADSVKEGLRLEMGGGRDPFVKTGRKQMAVIEFLCDEEKTGLEDYPDASKKSSRRSATAEDDDEDSDITPENGKSEARSLRYLHYDTSGDVDKLRLEWKTKFACESYLADKNAAKTSGWGGFTWFIIILFLVIASYLIFGSWVNYNRTGAQGFDMVPHADTIRDVPYMMKDFARRVVNTVKGGGSRGGYSAV